ncbi:MAG: hypothetical protein H7A26_00325 [Spirochaetales bacterium]|nr:hypothetical protein [Spirochaetales bacterium]
MLLFLVFLPSFAAPQELYDSFAQQRSALVSSFEKKYPKNDKKIFQALSSVKREDFLPEKIKKYAYIDISLPLDNTGTGTASGTIVSHSDILKILLNLQNTDRNRALVIGRGAGFTAAVLSSLYSTVFLIETDKGESDKYALFMPEIYPNIITQFTKEFNFFRSNRPFDLIVLNGSIESYAGEFTEDLSEKGELFFPLSDNDGFQLLYRAEKKGESYTIKVIDEVVFPKLN